MPTQVKCPSCSTLLQLPDSVQPGGAVRCPKCATVLRVPGQAPAAKSPAPPAPSAKSESRTATPAPASKPKPAAAPRPQVKAAAPAARPKTAPPKLSDGIKTPAPKAAAAKLAVDNGEDEDDDATRRTKAKPKSKKGLVLGILAGVFVLFLLCGGGITYGVYKLVFAVKEGVQKGKDYVQNVQKELDKMAKKRLDTSFIHIDANAAFVIHPSRIAKSKSSLIPPPPEQDKLLGDMIQQTGIDPRKIEQIIVVLEPAPPSPPGIRRQPPRPPKGPPRPGPKGDDPFLGGGIIRFIDPVNGQDILNKMLKQTDRVPTGAQSYYRSKTEKQNGLPIAGALEGDRTILVAPEPMLKKMLAARASSFGPLVDKLREFDLENDLFGVFLIPQSMKPMLKGLVQSPQMQAQFPTAKTLDQDLTAVKFTANVDGDKLLQITLEGTNDASAKNLEKLVDDGLNFGKIMYKGAKPNMQKQLPPDVAAKLLKVTDQIDDKNGITVIREGKNVVVTLNKPKDQ